VDNWARGPDIGFSNRKTVREVDEECHGDGIHFDGVPIPRDLEAEADAEVNFWQ
jgi:hypothetical protein